MHQKEIRKWFCFHQEIFLLLFYHLLKSDDLPNSFRYRLSEFLRWSLMIFIMKGFRTISFIFIVISTTFRPICPPAFFRCLNILSILLYTHIYVQRYTYTTYARTQSCGYVHIYIYVTPIWILIYIYPNPSHNQDASKGQFLISLKNLIQNFPSPRLVAIPRLKSLVCHTIYSYLEGE